MPSLLRRVISGTHDDLDEMGDLLAAAVDGLNAATADLRARLDAFPDAPEGEDP